MNSIIPPPTNPINTPYSLPVKKSDKKISICGCFHTVRPNKYFLRTWTIPAVFFIFLLNSIFQGFLFIIFLPDPEHYFKHLLVPDTNLKALFIFILFYSSAFWYSNYSYIKTIRRLEKHKVALRKDKTKVALFLTLDVIVTCLFVVFVFFVINKMYFGSGDQVERELKELDLESFKETVSKYVKEELIAQVSTIFWGGIS